MTDRDMLVLRGDVDPSGLAAARQLLADQVCRAVGYARESASTNSWALEELQAGELDEADCPKLYLADQQTAGRGRHGRQWVSTDQTLTFSLIAGLPSGDDTDRIGKLISLAVGLGVARALEFEFAPLSTRLKWPNDVYVGGGKVAGVLIEAAASSPGRVVIGVGINIGDSPKLKGPSERPVANLSQSVGRRVHRYESLAAIVKSVLGSIAEAGDSPDDLLGDFRSRCLLSGQPVRFDYVGQPQQGLCRGIGDAGELIVEVDGQRRTIQSGEANLVRRMRDEG